MKHNVKKTILLIIVSLSLCLFLYTFVHSALYVSDESGDFTQSQNASNALNSQTKTSSTTLSYPDRLIIPKLNVDARVQFVGLNTKGDMGIPNNFTDVGWYKYGTVPGNKGSAVVDGHVDNGLSLPGVFKHLSTLEKGDDIYILTKNGNTLHFVVDDKKYYNYRDQTVVNEIYNQNDFARLRLVTCVGDWVPSDKTYNQRLVVTTKISQ